MRAVIPQEIDRLFKIQLPYVFFDKSKEEWTLKDDAPPEVIKAREEYLSWWENQK